MITKPIYQVDAFTAEPFRGNPAGVCILKKEMPDKWMQDVAMEMNLSETSFILVQGQKEFPIRFFTPEAEIPLCGHATLASAHIMYETGIIPADNEIVFISKAGRLKIKLSGGWVIMNFPSYKAEKIPTPADIEKLIGILPSELYRTGHGWTLALLRSEKEVRDLKPDFKAMRNTEFGDLIVTAPSDDSHFDFCVRCFAPALGIDEDPVTGSAHCALVPFWHNRTGKNRFVSHQVSKREGILKVELIEDRVEISGQAKTILSGELFI